MCEQRWRLCRCYCLCRRCRRSCVLLEAGNIFSSLASNLPNRRILTFVAVVVVVVSPCVSLFDDFVSLSSSFALPAPTPLLSSPKRAQIVKKRKKDRKKYNKYQRSTVGKYKKKSRIILNLNETTVKLLYYFCYSVTLVW